MRIDNSWLSRSNSKNFHHFFPKSYLKKRGVEDWNANLIGNVTIVEEFLNKRKIGSRPPSEYMPEFSQSNCSSEQTMDSHLISVSTDRKWDIDYETFLDNRAERICSKLNERLQLRLH